MQDEALVIDSSALTRFALLAQATLAGVALFAQTQFAPPPGWTSHTSGKALVLNSPGDSPASRVALTLLPPGHPIGEIKSWFAKQTLAMAQSVGHALGATDVEDHDGILVRVVQMENDKQTKFRLVFYGYSTSNGTSVAVLAIPPVIEDKDPRLETANQFVQQIAAQRFEAGVVSAPAPATSAQLPQRNSRGQFEGPMGRTDIDLTYHAKAIPPKDRDVPLKAVYVFVGFAFGASYGGVGTNMTWGQRATQQLLLLYANGVAAKVDLRGGNLAGKYQAEGFASIDAANPSAVSGAPFGHWAEDNNAVHIQWNIGGPSDLTKNGRSLEGKSEKWNPYKLPDGEQIEGTFVRKMEAGLRSQAIVLHKDGTFQGDGVNVTMGGSLVSPAFPERGAGTYEIRKGSMILYFANGFTQAIACILDEANPGTVRTVVLNGFPFERVR